MAKKTRHHNALSFAELRSKEVVNSVDGKRMGRIIDIVFGLRDGRIQGIVVPHGRRNIIFRNNEPSFIPWELVERIGEDVLLVRIVNNGDRVHDRDRRNGRGYAINSYQGDEWGRDIAEAVTEIAESEEDDVEQNYTNENNSVRIQDNLGSKREGRDNGRPVRAVHDYDGAVPSQSSSVVVQRPVSKDPSSGDFMPGVDCDNQCQKCMLFDCRYRWKGG